MDVMFVLINLQTNVANIGVKQCCLRYFVLMVVRTLRNVLFLIKDNTDDKNENNSPITTEPKPLVMLYLIDGTQWIVYFACVCIDENRNLTIFLEIRVNLT